MIGVDWWWIRGFMRDDMGCIVCGRIIASISLRGRGTGFDLVSKLKIWCCWG